MAAVTALIAVGATAAVVGATTSAIAANKAKQARNIALTEADIQAAQVEALEKSRPTMTNPYDNVRNSFDGLNNEYANLTVSTEAFKIQAEQADQALANSLDVMMEVGMGAAGATALAQAALQSKRGIAASIGAQETKNRALQAEGAANVAKLKAQGQQNLDIQRAQGDFTVQRDAIGFHEMKMDRAANLMDNAKQNAADADAARSAAIVGIGTSVIAGAGIAAPGLGKLS